MLSLRQLGLVLDAQSVVLGGSRRLPTLRPQRLVNVVVTDQVNFLFADARVLSDDALEMLDQGKVRNVAEKAWGATKRATIV